MLIILLATSAQETKTLKKQEYQEKDFLFGRPLSPVASRPALQGAQ